MQGLLCGFIVHHDQSIVLPGFDSLGKAAQALAFCEAQSAAIGRKREGHLEVQRPFDNVAVCGLATGCGCVLLAMEAPLRLLATRRYAQKLASILHRHGTSLSAAVPELLSADGSGLESFPQTLMTSDADVLSFKTDLRCDDVMPFRTDSFLAAFDVASFLPSTDNLLAAGLLQPMPQQPQQHQQLASPQTGTGSLVTGYGSPVPALTMPRSTKVHALAKDTAGSAEASITAAAAAAAATTTMDGNSVQVVVAVSEDITIQFQNNLQQKLDIVGTVAVAAKRQRPATTEGGAAAAANGHDDLTTVVLRMSDPHSHIGPCQLNPQVQAAGKKESETVRLIRCRLPNAAEPLPVIKYKCAPEFRPALVRTRSALQVRDAMAKVTVELASNPAIDMPLSQVLIRVSLSKLAAVAPISSTQTRPEGRYDAASHVLEWRGQLNPGEKTRFEALLQLGTAVDPAQNTAALSPAVVVTATVPDRLLSDVAFSVDSAADPAGAALHPAIVNTPKRVRVAVKAV